MGRINRRHYHNYDSEQDAQKWNEELYLKYRS